LVATVIRWLRVKPVSRGRDSRIGFTESMSESFALAVVGDLMLLHPVSAYMTDPPAAALLDLIRGADVAIANCEVSGFDLTPSPAPQYDVGAPWLNAGADGIADIAALGFTMVSRANNHACDFGVAGLEETNRLLTRHRIAHAGTGSTLGAARAAAYATTPAGRTALISATDFAPKSAIAGQPQADMVGRAGVNPLRATRVKIVAPAVFQTLAAAMTMAHDDGLDLGQIAEDGCAIRGLGPLIRQGDHAEDRFILAKRDVADNLAQVRAARFGADHVVFALHSHLPDNLATMPPASIREFAHAVIEAGADVVVGHGTHRLRGIELHRGRPIFYGLGNFVCHIFKITAQPADLFDQLDLAPGTSFSDLLAQGHMRGVLHDAEQWEGVVARITRTGAATRIELHPIELCACARGARQGTPRLADADRSLRILERLRALSAPYGTHIDTAEGIGVIECAAEC
jgi:poly-gamma-glutamate synthesis protein (capsule biosynthesis protein)